MPRYKPEAADPQACRSHALKLLARREHSRLELERKLLARDFPRETIAEILDTLEREGALAVDRFVETFIRSRARKGQGPVRIRAELLARGITADEAAAALRAAEWDWVEIAAAARRKHFGSAPPEGFEARARQMRFLQYRGFDAEQAAAALEVGADSD